MSPATTALFGCRSRAFGCGPYAACDSIQFWDRANVACVVRRKALEQQEVEAGRAMRAYTGTLAQSKWKAILRTAVPGPTCFSRTRTPQPDTVKTCGRILRCVVAECRQMVAINVEKPIPNARRAGNCGGPQCPDLREIPCKTVQNMCTGVRSTINITHNGFTRPRGYPGAKSRGF